MSEKLDSLSKIIIATGQINYMAAQINTVCQQTRALKDNDGIFSRAIYDIETCLSEAVDKLSHIMQDMGNLMDGKDMVSVIDERISQVPFEIIVHGMDLVEKSYDEDVEGYVAQPQ